MLIAHLADVHLGVTPYNIHELWEDQFEALEESIDIALREHVDAIIIAGDLFDKVLPDNRTRVKAVDILKKPVEKGTPIVAISGDHDTPKGRDLSPLATLARALGDKFIFPQPVKGGSLVETLSPTVFRLGNVYVVSPPFIRGLQSERESKMRDMINAQKRLLKLRGAKKALFVAHFTFQGLAPWDPVISPSELPDEVVYAAMGHLHRRIIRVKSPDAPAFSYPGSLCPLNIEEAEEDHTRGPLLVDMSGEVPVVHQPRVEVRTHVALRFKASGLDEIRRTVARSVKGVKPARKRPLVHLYVEVPPSAHSMWKYRNLIGKLSSELNVVIKANIKSYDSETLLELSAEPELVEEEVLAKFLGGNMELAQLVARLKEALASGNMDEAKEVIDRLLADKYTPLWRRILSKGGGR